MSEQLPGESDDESIQSARQLFQEKLATLIAEGFDVNEVNNGEKTVLMWAAQKGYGYIVEILIRNGVDVNVTDDHGMNALIHVVMERYTRERYEQPRMWGPGQFITDEWMHINTPKGRSTGLDEVIRKKKEEVTITKMLIERGIDVNVTYNGKTPLMLAAKSCRWEIVEELIMGDVNVDITDEDGDTPLRLVVEGRCSNKIKIAKMLIEKGADVNIINNNGRTALMNAAYNGHWEIVVLLIKANANINIADVFGNTALTFAIQDVRHSIARILIMNGANVNVNDLDGITPLMKAASGGSLCMIRMVINAGADINITACNGSTALITAAVKGHDEIVRILIDKGADIDATDMYGRTPLIYASRHNHREIVKELIRAGANPEIVDNESKTARNNWKGDKTEFDHIVEIIAGEKMIKAAHRN